MTFDRSTIHQALRWAFWWLALAGLSWALLSPIPPQVGARVLPPDLTFTASKAVHLAAYAFLSAFVAWLPANAPQRLACWLFLAGHAAVTEYFQTFVPDRYGSVRDVCINLAGLSLGLLLARLSDRRGWTAPLTPTPAAPATSAPRQ